VIALFGRIPTDIRFHFLDSLKAPRPTLGQRLAPSRETRPRANVVRRRGDAGAKVIAARVHAGTLRAPSTSNRSQPHVFGRAAIINLPGFFDVRSKIRQVEVVTCGIIRYVFPLYRMIAHR
jgi:hypothetical protein